MDAFVSCECILYHVKELLLSSDRRALAAMSGGVDSSVAALLLKEQGYDVIGATMKLYANEAIGIAQEKTCCSLSDIEDARQVASSIGIPYYVMNFEEEFERQVMQRFAEEYEHARTPNPCIVCNQYLKFGSLMKRAQALGCDYVATGHYARVERDEKSGRYLLKKAADAAKDQTYMLYRLSQEELSHALFPLGSLTKEEVRSLAQAHGLVNSRKRDSQDICFVQNGSYADFLERYRGRKWPEGDFVTQDHRVLGRHKGLIRYTIGQRKGLGLSLPEPMYVVRLDPERNEVVLGREEDLYSSTAVVDHINLMAVPSLDEPMAVTVKTRYSQKEASATARQTGPDEITIDFEAPQRAVTPGQSAVLYRGDTVVGGGLIR